MNAPTIWTTSLCAGLTVSLLSNLNAQEISFGEPQRLEVPELTKLEGPELVDYDGDGVRDLLSGNYSGNLIFRKNTGSNEAPVYAKPVNLQRAGEDIKLKHW